MGPMPSEPGAAGQTQSASTATAGAGPRLHALDALRATMMFLGLAVHTGNSYLAHPVPDSWPFSDAQRSELFDIGIYIVHLFRMPAFFAVAGLFAARVSSSRGLSSWTKDRLRRIALPILVFIQPALWGDTFSYAFANTQSFEAALAAAKGAAVWRDPLGRIFGHLWFLYDLVWFYAAYLACAALVRRSPAAARVADALARSLRTWRGWAAFALVLGVVLGSLPFAVLVSSESLVPKASELLGYGLFFAAGVAMHREPALLASLPSRAGRLVGVGLLLAFVNMALLFAAVEEQGTVSLSVGVGTLLTIPVGLSAALAALALTFGSFALFLRFVRPDGPGGGEKGAWRYLADASYWVYLAHHSLCVFFAGLLAPLTWPALAKFSTVVGLTAAVTLTTYQLFVRHTWVGLWLNGRRR